MGKRSGALRLVLVLATLTASATLPACKSGQGLNNLASDVGEQIDRVFGRSTLPGKHLATIESCRDPAEGWRFDPEVPDAFDKTREAVRGLATCDYSRWNETALVVQVLTTMSEDHPSALVRAECLDTLTIIGAWTIAAAPGEESRTTEDQVLEGLKVLKDAPQYDRSDPASAQAVAGAINTLAGFRFDAAKAPPKNAELRAVARVMRSQLGTCRGVLRALNGTTIDGFETDPRVRDALDRAWVSCSASAVRAALLTSAVGDTSDIARGAAVRNLGTVRPSIGADILAVVLREDLVSSVRREAARALSQYDAAQAVPALIPALSDDMPEVRSAATLSLSSLTGETFGEDRGQWLRWWQAGPKLSGGAANGGSGQAGAAPASK